MSIFSLIFVHGFLFYYYYIFVSTYMCLGTHVCLHVKMHAHIWKPCSPSTMSMSWTQSQGWANLNANSSSSEAEKFGVDIVKSLHWSSEFSIWKWFSKLPCEPTLPPKFLRRNSSVFSNRDFAECHCEVCLTCGCQAHEKKDLLLWTE